MRRELLEFVIYHRFKVREHSPLEVGRDVSSTRALHEKLRKELQVSLVRATGKGSFEISGGVNNTGGIATGVHRLFRLLTRNAPSSHSF